jgi:uncharacterized membrane protein affecting hemolysin expression
MGEHMKHLEEEELVGHYYEESANMAESERHLKACPACASRYAELCRVLEAVVPPTPPARGKDYVEQVWQSIGASLPVYEKPRRQWMRYYRPLGWAAACVLLVAMAFLAGRRWERKQAPQVAVAVDPQARQRVVIVVLGDHLDRSERLLVQLNHAGAGDLSSLLLRSEAQELLASNRLVRQSAAQAGDLSVEASLDRLERLLMELANEPGNLTEADINRLRQEMNTDGLLFDIRVLRSRVKSPETKGVPI